MTPRLAWYVARAAGITAWGLLATAVIWGLLLSTRVLRGRPTPRWLLDLHRFLGGLAVVFTGVHLGGLMADNYLHFGLADLLVPFAAGWRPGAVALGVVGLWLLAAVEITSLLTRRMPRRWWHAVHLSSYALFWTATLHALLAGTDAGRRPFVIAVDTAAAVVLALTAIRVTVPRPGHRRGPQRRPVPAHPRRPLPTR
jgi:DMSO/TMAO reductase YedYZ heme-binding membrane subunit